MKPLVSFIYLGRQGALGRFALELAQGAARATGQRFDFIISSDSEVADDFAASGLDVFQVPTFQRATPVDLVTRFPATRRRLLEHLKETDPAAVVMLMPHVWSPLLAPAIRKLGIKYVTIIHDVVPHPGDRTAIVTPWLRRDAKEADLVITLCRAVAERIVTSKLAPPERVLPLFHPDLTYGAMPKIRERHDPLRLLFFGRIMAYKGLPLLIDAVEAARQSGLKVDLGVAGSGPLGEDRARLEAMGADITNRWIADSEVHDIFSRFDAMACSHVEASQSGVVSAAFGNGLPVVAMPIGGIAEQVVDGRTGLLSRQITAPAFADAIRRLATEPGLYETIARTLIEEAPQRSMDRFLGEIAGEVRRLAPGRTG